MVDQALELTFLANDPFQTYNGLSEPFLTIKRQAVADHVPIVHDQLGLFLEMLLGLKKPAKVLEIGAGIGYGSLWMIKGSPFSQFVLLEPDPARRRILNVNLERFAPAAKTAVLPLKAEDFWEQTQKTSGPASEIFDLIFLDSAKKQYLPLLEIIYPMLKKGGLLVADNVGFSGLVFQSAEELKKSYPKYFPMVEAMQKFNRNLSQNPKWQSRFFNLADGVLVAEKRASAKI